MVLDLAGLRTPSGLDLWSLGVAHRARKRAVSRSVRTTESRIETIGLRSGLDGNYQDYLSLVALPGCAARCARADLTVVQSIETGGSIFNRVTTKNKGEQCARIDVNPESSMIVDTKTGEVVTLMPKTKAVLRLSRRKKPEITSATKPERLLKDTDNSSASLPPETRPARKRRSMADAEEAQIAETRHIGPPIGSLRPIPTTRSSCAR